MNKTFHFVWKPEKLMLFSNILIFCLLQSNSENYLPFKINTDQFLTPGIFDILNENNLSLHFNCQTLPLT